MRGKREIGCAVHHFSLVWLLEILKVRCNDTRYGRGVEHGAHVACQECRAIKTAWLASSKRCLSAFAFAGGIADGQASAL